MNDLRLFLRKLGYREFQPLELRTRQVEVQEAAYHNGQPHVAIGKTLGQKTNRKKVSVPHLPDSVEYLVLNGEHGNFFERISGRRFESCPLVPKANGVVWGEHSRKDLIPLSDLSNLIKTAVTMIKKKRDSAVLAYILAFKLMDELHTGKLGFRFSEYNLVDVYHQLTELAVQFALEKGWRQNTVQFDDELREVSLRWQPYRFLPQVEETGVFTHIMKLLGTPTRSILNISEPIIRLVQGLLSGCEEPVGIVGEGACGFLDIPLIYGKRAKRICDSCPLIIEKLADELLTDFDFLKLEFLGCDKLEEWSTLIVIPPFGRRRVNRNELEKIGIDETTKELITGAANHEFIWLVKCHQVLKENGRLVILLSEGFLSNASLAVARKWVLSKFDTEAIVSLPVSALGKSTAFKCSLALLRKRTPPRNRYDIFMAELNLEDLNQPGEIIRAYRNATQEEA